MMPAPTTKVTTEYQIRKAQVGEVSAIVRIFEDEVRAGRMLPRKPDEMRANIDSWLVAVDGEEVIGCVSLVFFNQTLCEVRSLAVHPAYQGNGLGSKLVSAAVKFAEEKDMTHVLTLTRATGVFTKLGFELDSVFHYPEKVWKDCTPCPLRERCDEVALLYRIKKEK